MNRPDQKRPQEQSFKLDDEKLSKILSHVLNKVLKVESTWKIYVPALGNEVSFKEVLMQFQKGNVSPMWYDVLVEFFRALPSHFNIIRRDIENVFTNALTMIEERAGFIEEQGIYIDYIESQLEENQHQMDRLEETKRLLEKEKEVIQLTAKLEQSKEVIEQMRPVKPKRKVAVTTKPKEEPPAMPMQSAQKPEEVEEEL